MQKKLHSSSTMPCGRIPRTPRKLTSTQPMQFSANCTDGPASRQYSAPYSRWPTSLYPVQLFLSRNAHRPDTAMTISCDLRHYNAQVESHRRRTSSSKLIVREWRKTYVDCLDVSLRATHQGDEKFGDPRVAEDHATSRGD